MKYYILFLAHCLLFSCIEEDKKTTETGDIKAEVNGKDVYKANCVACHGMDGKLGFSGAKDLTKSTSTQAEIEHQVTKGKGSMAGFEKTLTHEEIVQVSAYAIRLRP
jgi:cytochrome c6